MRLLHMVALGGALLIAAACGSSTPTGPADGATGEPTAGPTLPTADASALRYTCDSRFPFTADLLTRPGGDELAATPLAAALRAHLAKQDLDIDWLPDSGWTLLGEDETGAAFIAPGGDTGLLTVSLDHVGRVWAVNGWGDCQPMRVLPPGLGDATWALPPEAAIGPATTEFVALVTERDCASGSPSVGRVVGPDILLLEDRVLVTFGVRPLGGDAQTCQGNPATPVSVVLPEPLGDRKLLDGSTLPPRDPTAEP